MANNFTGHVNKWLLLSESETDFATLFVRSWIPFNAWYCNNYNNTSDRYCLDEIKSDGNQFRARLIALLDGSSTEAVRFHTYIKELNDLLNSFPIPDASENRISFSNIYFRSNPITVIPHTRKRNLEYKTEKLNNNSVNALIVDPSTNPIATKYNYVHTRWDLNHFETDLNNSSLNDSQKRYLKEFFQKINPKQKETIIATKKAGSIDIQGLYLINDFNLVSSAIIEILYGIRCKLFHGELQPSKDNLSIYEPAYHIMRTLLKSLI